MTFILSILTPQLSVAVCLGFVVAWTPYAVVSMWAALTDATQVPPTAFALAAIFAKSSTIYNPVVHLLCKPNFRESLYRDMSAFLRRIYRGSPQSEPKESDCGNLGSHSQSNNNMGSSARFTQRQHYDYGMCRHCTDNVSQCNTPPTAERTVWSGSTCREGTVWWPSDKPQQDCYYPDHIYINSSPNKQHHSKNMQVCIRSKYQCVKTIFMALIDIYTHYTITKPKS